jgi:hypothetical protein
MVMVDSNERSDSGFIMSPKFVFRRGRFRLTFPVLSRLLASTQPPLLIIAFSAIALIYSINLALSVLYLLILWAAYSIERRHLDCLLITPLTALTIYMFYSWGVGPVFLTISRHGQSQQELVIIQVVGLFAFAVFAGCYSVKCRHLAPVRIPDPDSPDFHRYYPSIRTIAACLTAFTFALIMIRTVTGIGERGHVGAELEQQLQGDIRVGFLAAFYRLELIGIMFMGLLLRGRNLLGRALAIATIGAYLVFGFTSGTRGLILHPLIAFVCGYYLFGGSVKLIKLILILGVVVGIPLIAVMGVMRSSREFYESRMSDVSTRFELGLEALSSVRAADINDNLDLTGQALLGVSDEYVYRDTPELIPFAGWDGFSAVLQVFVPHFFRPGTATLGDENEIVESYTGVEVERSFRTISFFADMYRRFGFPGLVIGTFIAAWFFATISARVISIFHSRRRLCGLMFLMLMMEGYMLFPFSTLLRSFWLWFYDIPKHLVVLIALVIAVTAFRPLYFRSANRRVLVHQRLG